MARFRILNAAKRGHDLHFEVHTDTSKRSGGSPDRRYVQNWEWTAQPPEGLTVEEWEQQILDQIAGLAKAHNDLVAEKIHAPMVGIEREAR